MEIELESGLELVQDQPACIESVVFVSGQNNFTIAEDDRGKVFLFKRVERPAVFIEVIKTYEGKIRGNHVHENCTEILHVISGEIHLYLLCKHGEHVFKQPLKRGEAIITPAGMPHALYSVQESECLVLFDKDPSNDRVRIPIIRF